MAKIFRPIGSPTGAGASFSTTTPSGKTFTPIGGGAKKKSGGGFLSHIPGVNAVAKVASQAGKDVYHAAVNSPAGLYYAGKAVGSDVTHGIANVPQNLAATVGLAKPAKRPSATVSMLGAAAHQTAQDLTHPLRHPGLTGLDLLGIASLGAGTAARVGEVGRVARAGEGAGAVARAAARGPTPGVRTFKVGDLEVTKPASKAASTRAVHSVLDKRRNAAAAAKPGGRAARSVARKAGKAQEETLRIEERIATAPAAGLQALGKGLKPHEKMALRVVAEEAPIDKRIAASRARQAAAKSPLEARRHGVRVKQMEKAKPLLTERNGKPALASPRLQGVYDRMQKVAGGREALGKQLGLLTDETIRGRKTLAGRVAMGAKLGDTIAPATRKTLQVGHTVRVAGKNTTGKVADIRGNHATVYYPRFSRSQRVPIKDLEVVGKPTIQGQESFTASPSSTYVPDIEQRFGRSGRVTSMGAQGTVGNPLNPIKQGYTGGAKAAAREPLDTTKAVAEANLAVTKYARLTNLQKNLRQAVSPVPRFKDDIAVRLDRIGANESLPPDGRQFVTDPTSLETLTPEEQASRFEQLRKSFILGGDKEISNLAPEQVAHFQRLHAEGKIGWVPRRLLGDLAKPHAPLRAAIGKVPTSIIDATNNATKLSVLYLKPAYAVPNLLGNLALNLIQQGFAAPRNLASAVRLTHQIGPELTAHVDTIMGEGFASALRGEGTNLPAAITQAAANVWGKGVDKPFRRASFIHEATHAGYRTPQQLSRLLTDPMEHEALINVAKRANREIIDYARLSSREREIVRRVIFFYPWVKGSTLYAGHLLLEHPVKGAALGQLGVIGREKSQAELGPTPSFLEGAFKGPGGGLVNPTAAAILQTPAQVGAALAGLAGGNAPATGDLAQFLTPALSVAANKIAKQNLFTGQPYAKGHQGLLDVAKDTLLSSAPQAQLYQGIKGTSKSKLYPGSPRTAIGRYLLGGLYPRPYNAGRLHGLARREQRGK